MVAGMALRLMCVAASANRVDVSAAGVGRAVTRSGDAGGAQPLLEPCARSVADGREVHGG